jgi:hypothetical protein
VKFGQLLHKPFEKMRVFRPILHEDNDFHAEFRYNVRDTLDRSDPLAAEIFTLGKDAAWIRELPEDSDEGIQWKQRRATVVRAAARRIC